LNKIEAKKYKSKFSNLEHLVILIDEKPLDLFLNEKVSDNIEGLVPSISWLDSKLERDYAINKLLPENKVKMTIAPILICPDDMDLSCTVIVVDIEFKKDLVIFKNFGFDTSSITNPISLGRKVTWFKGIDSLEFDRTEYEKCMKNLILEEF